MRNYRPELVALPGGVIPPDRPHPPPAAPRRQSLVTPPSAAGTPPTPQNQGLRINQEAEQNPHPAPQMKICMGFRIRTTIDKAEANGVNIPLPEDNCHFCLYVPPQRCAQTGGTRTDRSPRANLGVLAIEENIYAAGMRRRQCGRWKQASEDRCSPSLPEQAVPKGPEEGGAPRGGRMRHIHPPHRSKRQNLTEWGTGNEKT